MTGDIRQNIIQSFEIGLKLLLETVIDYDQQTLTDQGHRATGKLIDTLSYKIVIGSDTIVGEFYMQDYGLDVDQGIKARDVFKVDPGKIKEWAKVVNPSLSSDEVDSFVAATFKRWDKEGIPLDDGNSRFSKDGSRTGWIGRGSTFLKDQGESFIAIDSVLDALLEATLNIFSGEPQTVSA